MKTIKKWITEFNQIQTIFDDIEILFEYREEGENTSEEIEESYSKCIQHLEDLEFKNMLSNEGDNLSIIAGGDVSNT